MKVTIFIPGQTPSKKNSKQIVLPGDGRRRVISSEFYTTWEKQALLRLRQHELVGYKWRYPLRAGFHYVRKGHHRFDYNNLNQGSLDLLVKVGIIEDDSMKHIIPNGALSYEVDKDRLGVYITLEEIEEVTSGAHTRIEGVLRAGTVQAETPSQNQGQGQKGAQGLAQHPQGDECVSLPILRGRLGPGQQVRKKRCPELVKGKRDRS